MPRFIAPLVVLAGSALLLVSLFLDWYEPATDAWTAFELLDLVLAGLTILAVSAAGPALLRDAWPPHGRAVPGIGAAAALIVLSQVINPPPAIPGDAGPRIGAWLALVGALIMACGGVLANRSQAASSRRRRGRERSMDDTRRRRERGA